MKNPGPKTKKTKESKLDIFLKALETEFEAINTGYDLNTYFDTSDCECETECSECGHELDEGQANECSQCEARKDFRQAVDNALQKVL